MARPLSLSMPVCMGIARVITLLFLVILMLSDRIRFLFDNKWSDRSGSAKKRTIVIFEKVPKTGTTSLRKHFVRIPNTCNVDVNGFWNESLVAIDKKPKCRCEDDIIISHLTRFPAFMEHALGHCQFQNVDVLSVIPIRYNRIDSELDYGQNFLGLSPNKSIFDNMYSYKFNPYLEYSQNILKNRTCLYPFINGGLKILHENPTSSGKFTCTSDACNRSIEVVKLQEQNQLEKLHQEFPICDTAELSTLLNLSIND